MGAEGTDLWCTCGVCLSASVPSAREGVREGSLRVLQLGRCGAGGIEGTARILRPVVTNAMLTSESAIEALSHYEDVDDESVQNYSEFTLANNMYYCMIESACSEQSARMSAMQNATDNAEDMIESLRLRFNRGRQAVITTELIEIISGSAALEDA